MKTTTHGEGAARVPVLCGADIELGNFVLGARTREGTGDKASRALLREIEGLPRASRSRPPAGCDCPMCRSEASGAATRNGKSPKGGGFNPQDWGRKYLASNGGCVYVDLDHLELCLPEVASAFDHVACWHAMLRLARGAMEAANAKMPQGRKLQVLVNNTDGRGNSYGSHLDFLVTRRTWDNIFRRRMHYMLYLASYQVSSIVFTGQGKVGGENGVGGVAFQLSQRADFFETLVGPQTTCQRPVVNSRDEPLCGRRGARELARLHVIFFDNTLCHVASLLKVGVMQIVLAMIEAGRVNVELILEDPVEAVGRWSRDPSLRETARLVSGREVTAVGLQQLFLAEAKTFVAEGGCEGLVPRAGELVALWEDTLMKLAAGDLASLAPRLDWVLKLSVLRQVLASRPDLGWDSPQLKHLDHVYSSLDREEGLYWAYERGGVVERVVAEEEVERFTREPPDETRAWARARLLRLAGPETVEEVNWDFIRFKLAGDSGRVRTRTLDMSNPLSLTRADVEGVFGGDGGLAEVLDALGAPAEDERPPAFGGARPGFAPAGAGLLAPWRGGAGYRKEKDDEDI